jgi:uncharacterized protein (TIGR02145 family)
VKIFNKKIILLFASALLAVGCVKTATDDTSIGSLLVSTEDNISPIAKSNKTDVSVRQGETIKLDASASTDEDGGIVSYSWQLSNGTILGTDTTLTYDSSSLEVGRHKIRLVVTDDAGATDVVEVIITVKDTAIIAAPTSITHNGTTYGFVTSPHTGKVWLDRNLGASSVCEQLDDDACYGDYYQWGRNTDGHEDSMSKTTEVQALDLDSVGIEFIALNGFFFTPIDWLKDAKSGSIREANWSGTDGSSVCPEGYRVPTVTELELETIGADIANSDTAFENFLKLPSSGFRHKRSGDIVSQDLAGYLWSNTTSSTSSSLISYSSSSAQSDVENRTYGYPVRCMED